MWGLDSEVFEIVQLCVVRVQNVRGLIISA